ncbi:MAG: Na+ dependent nucleoside transporter N-terminal domain-containing protein, partial [Tangfeifania sp.]
MKQFLFMLVVVTGIFFFQPVHSQNTETTTENAEQISPTEQESSDTSVLLLSEERETPFTISALFRGLLGMAALIFLGFLLSTNRRNIPWRTVIIGLIIQIALAVGVLYVPFIRVIFEFFGQIFVKILDFTKAGSEFLLGDLMDADTYGYIFLFQVLPTIIFFSALTSLLFYWGIIQKVVYGMAWVFTKALKISGAEALSVAGNIFLGQTESPLLIKAYLNKISKSEMLLVMTGGMATLAGGVLAAYIAMLGG